MRLSLEPASKVMESIRGDDNPFHHKLHSASRSKWNSKQHHQVSQREVRESAISSSCASRSDDHVGSSRCKGESRRSTDLAARAGYQRYFISP